VSAAAGTVRARVLERTGAPLADQGKRPVGCNYGSSVPAIDFQRLASLYLSGRLALDGLVGRRAGLDDADLALAELRDAVGLRTILEPEAG
jgi:S-(hydroxymethyl)glutathione dehydrogenase/alcohol dehydrogenase